MRNLPPSEIELLRIAEQELGERFPRDWLVELTQVTTAADRGRDATLRISEPGGGEASIAVEVKGRASPKDVIRLSDSARPERGENETKIMLIAPYLSPRAREELEREDLAYIDATGNVYLMLSRPAVFLKVTGASTNPWPEDRALRSLRGGVSGRVVRALLDFDGPCSITDLAQLAGVPVPTASRVVSLLDRDAVLMKDGRGRSVFIDLVDKPKLLRRWTDDYGVLKSNRATRALAPRGIPSLLDDLRAAPWRYAITGSLAAAQLAPYAPSRLALIYVNDQGAAERGLDVIADADSPNVFLLTPFDKVAFERTWERDGLRYAAPAQVAADLLTSPGRGPSEAEELIKWMEQRGSWRT